MKYNNFGQKIKIVRIKATSIEILYHQHSNRSERFGVLPLYIWNSVNSNQLILWLSCVFIALHNFYLSDAAGTEKEYTNTRATGTAHKCLPRR